MTYRAFLNLFAGLGPNSVFVLSRAEGSDVADDPDAAEAEMSAVFGSAA